jgi:hypothetical protein
VSDSLSGRGTDIHGIPWAAIARRRAESGSGSKM